MEHYEDDFNVFNISIISTSFPSSGPNIGGVPKAGILPEEKREVHKILSCKFRRKKKHYFVK
jgi:hypothetical protein